MDYNGLMRTAQALLMIFLLALLPTASRAEETYDRLKQQIISKYVAIVPREWGESVAGVKTRLATQEKVIALTFDACGSAGDGYDKDLIDYLEQEQIPATLFINDRWIDK